MNENQINREKIMELLPSEYKMLFDLWSDEDVKKYLYLINITTPQITYERSLRPDILGLAVAIHERAEITFMANILSQDSEEDFKFAEKLRANQLTANQVNGYFTPEGVSSPRKIYYAAHRQAYRLEMQFLTELANKLAKNVSAPALFATSPRILNSYGDYIKDRKAHEEMYHKEKATQLGDEARNDEYKNFPPQDEIKKAYQFWKYFSNPYSEEVEKALNEQTD